MTDTRLSALFNILLLVREFPDWSAELWKFLLGILELTQRYPRLHIPRLAEDI